MKKILLMGLTEIDNIGDHFVSQCVQYLVRNYDEPNWGNQMVSLTQPSKIFAT